MLIRLLDLTIMLSLLASVAAKASAAPSRPFTAVPFHPGDWWTKAPAMPLKAPANVEMGRLSLAWDADAIYPHLTDAAPTGALVLQFVSGERWFPWHDGALDATLPWKHVGLPDGTRNALVPLNVGVSRPNGATVWLPKDPLGLNTLTWGVISLGDANPRDCAQTLTRPFRFRFDPKAGHPALIFEPEPVEGLCLPVDLTFTSIGAQDTVTRTLRTSGGRACFELLAKPGDSCAGITLKPAGYTDAGSVAEYRGLAAGIRLETYRGAPGWEEPADWQAFWDRAKLELSTVPARPRITEVKDAPSKTGRLYRVELDSLGHVTIVCWYYVPKDVDVLAGTSAKRYPAVQIMPGYGSEEPPIDRTREGFITLSVNPRGHGPSNAFWPLPGDHLSWHITEPDQYYYRGAYMDCLRAMDWLMSRPEVNPKAVGVEGSSQGGAFSLATAAMDHRVAACSANVPFLCDWPDSVRLCTRGGFGQLRPRFEAEDDEGAAIRKTIGYIDAMFMAGHIHCPTLISAGEMDRTCPPAGGAAAYNRIPRGVEKQLLIVPLRDHEVMPEWRVATTRWFARWLKR